MYIYNYRDAIGSGQCRPVGRNDQRLAKGWSPGLLRHGEAGPGAGFPILIKIKR